MNYIFSGMIIISLICGAVTGQLNETVNAAFDGAGAAVKVMLSLAGTMCFWTGFLKIAERSGASRFMAYLFSPLVRLLFKNVSPKTAEYISMNMSANFLGTGNAATPMGIKAMNEMDKENPTPNTPTRNMCMLVAINTASLQFVPTTILALRSAAGSADPACIIIPVWIASLCGFSSAATAVKLFVRK